MKLQPNEILIYLGFNVPSEGIEIHSSEVHLYAESLRLLGSTFNISAIPDSELGNLHSETLKLMNNAIDIMTITHSEFGNMNAGFAALIRTLQDEDPHGNSQPNMQISTWLRTLLAANLSVIHKPSKAHMLE